MAGRGKSKTRSELSRYEAARQLEVVAEQLRSGAVVIDDRTRTVPDQVRLDLESEEGELEIEVKWKAAATRKPEREHRERMHRAKEGARRGASPAIGAFLVFTGAAMLALAFRRRAASGSP